MLKNVRCKNGYAVSSIGKVGFYYLVLTIVSNHCYTNNFFSINFTLEQFITD